jgi:RpiR family transcriptional regulator, carbohydrate utilization regulator
MGQDSKDGSQLVVVPEGVRARIRSVYTTLSEAEQRVARFIEERPADVIRLAVRALAEQVGVSEATVIRCCQSLGYAGLRDLKLALAVETATPLQLIHEAIQPGDSALVIAQKVLHADIQAIADTLAVLDHDALERTVTALTAARRIEFYGVGSSISVVMDAYYRFLRIGIPTAAVTDPYVQIVSAAQLSHDCVAFAISHSGRSVETLNALQTARRQGATCILLTSHANSPIGEHADIQLITADRDVTQHKESAARRIAQLSLIDALCMAVLAGQADKSRAAEARVTVAFTERVPRS